MSETNAMQPARRGAAMVLFSGGQDSTTCLAWALSRFERVETLGFDYGQRHAVELECRKTVLEKLRAFRPEWVQRLGEDHMLDMGFAPALKKIVAKIPKKRHTQMFSATMPDNILQLAQSLLQEPETVMVTPTAATADRVEQSLCMVGSQAEKRPLTLDLLEQQEQPGRTLIFTRTKHGANRLASFLTGKDHPASAIHGDKSQGTRERMLREFRSGETPILVATDIAARGIDVKDVQLVINYDLPEEPEVYVHRIGRTARAGAAGQAIALCSPDEIKKARDVHKLLGRLLPVHSSSATIPSELQTVPGTHRERKNSMQENRSASRRGPRKSYGRRNSAGRQGSRAGA